MYQDHRERLLESLADRDCAGLFFTGSAPTRNNDCEYRFRPDSDFWYLTGFVEPDSALVLLPHGDGIESVLFLRPRNPEQETWTGRRLGVERAPEALGVDAAYPIEELWQRLPDLLAGHRRVMYRTGQCEARDRKVFELAATLRGKVRQGVEAPLEWIDPSEDLHEQRLLKTPAELAAMRRAAEITTEAHLAAMAAAAPGVNEAELDALIDYTFRRNGSSGQAYTNIVAGGGNACILHYIENDQPLRDGDLVLIDAGCEWEFYAADVTRTFPVNGSFSPEQKALYELVLAAEEAGIARVAPGATFLSVHEAAVDVLARGLVDLGLLPGPVETVIEEKTYARFFMHKTGHWLGLDVHDCGVYHRGGESRALEPGMVTTVEPGIYVAEDDETVEARWRGIGIRIEDDVLVTESGHEVLTAAIPKSVADVEAACAAAARSASPPATARAPKAMAGAARAGN